MKYKYKKLKLKSGRLVDEHRLIMEKHLGRKLTFHEVVHHVNGNPRDNRLENLKLMTRAEHAIEHMPEDRKFGKNATAMNFGKTEQLKLW